MPRDSSGVYTLPAGNPVEPGTVISSSWANTTMDDVATALTASLDRNGNGGMLSPFKNQDGNLNGPGITWTNEPSSGLFRAAAGDMRLGVQGTPKMRWRQPGNTEVWDTTTSSWIDIFNIGAKKGVLVTLVGVDTLAIAGRHYHVTTAGVTITLPDNPAVSDQVGVSVRNFSNVVVASNGKNIAGAVQDVTLDIPDLYLLFQYTGQPEGWIIVSQALSSAVTGGLPTTGNAEGQLLRWDDTAERYVPAPNQTIDSGGVMKGLFGGDGVVVPDAKIQVALALPGTPEPNTLYFIPTVGVYLGASLIAEVNAP